jgi:hypothetical protein
MAFGWEAKLSARATKIFETEAVALVAVATAALIELE